MGKLGAIEPNFPNNGETWDDGAEFPERWGNLGRLSRISRIVEYVGLSHDIMEEFKYSWLSAYYLAEDTMRNFI